MSVENVGRYQVELPSVDEVMRYEQQTMPIRRKAAQAEAETRRLEALRDALLPELLSGRLRVPEAREAVAEVVDAHD